MEAVAVGCRIIVGFAKLATTIKQTKTLTEKNIIQINKIKLYIYKMEYRFDLINHLIERHGYKNYLEIGTQNSVCGSNVKCLNKVGVDPNPINRIDGDFNQHFKCTSDYYFSRNKETFDIIFIDGLHDYGQVSKDYLNSTVRLNDGGCIVLHDCLPADEERAKSFNDGGIWNGDCYRFIQDLEDSRVKFYISDFDQGCAVVYKNDMNPIRFKNSELSFTDWQNKLSTKKILTSNEIINISLLSS